MSLGSLIFDSVKMAEEMNVILLCHLPIFKKVKKHQLKNQTSLIINEAWIYKKIVVKINPLPGCLQLTSIFI